MDPGFNLTGWDYPDSTPLDRELIVTATYQKIGGGETPTQPTLPIFIPGGTNTEIVYRDADYDAVKVHMAYIFGYPEGDVLPDGNMTRAEAAAMIARLVGYPAADSSQPKFTDTPGGWYNAVINAVVKKGVMQGYPDGSFKPNNPITRAEFAQMLMPIDKKSSGVAPFEDVKGHWGEPAINQAYGNGRILGYPDGTFKPNNNITRAEAATILNRMFDRKVTEEGLRDFRSTLKKFSDLNSSHWAYYEMIEATNSHVFVRIKANQLDERWIELIHEYGK